MPYVTLRQQLEERNLTNSKDLAAILGFSHQSMITHHRQKGNIPEPAEYVGRWPAWSAEQVAEIRKTFNR